MGIVIRIATIVVALGSSILILRSVRRQRLTLGFATTWLMIAVVIAILGLGGDRVLDPIAKDFGVTYPPTLLFLGAILVLLFLTAYLSAQVAELERKISDVVDRYGRDHVQDPDVGPDTDRGARNADC